jgi:hypothetical protein
MDVLENATPLPTVLCHLALQMADVEGYRVLPRGPIQLCSAREMPPSMSDGAKYRDVDEPDDVRSLRFQGGGSLVMCSPLFASTSKKRKRLAVHEPLATVTGAAGASSSEQQQQQQQQHHHDEDENAQDALEAKFHTTHSPWHVIPMLPSAAALRHDRRHGWTIRLPSAGESTSTSTSLDRMNAAHCGSKRRLASQRSEFVRLHRRRFLYGRVMPFGIQLICDTWQQQQQQQQQQQPRSSSSSPLSSLRFTTDSEADGSSSIVCDDNHPTNKNEACGGLDKDDGQEETVGITLVYARATAVVRSPRHRRAAGEEKEEEQENDKQTRLYRIAPPTWRREDLLSECSVFVYFRGIGQCEYGASPCHVRADPACSNSCCSAEHCAQVSSDGVACSAQQE